MTQVNQIHHLNDLTITTNEEKDVKMENRLCRMPETIYIIHRKYIYRIATVVVVFVLTSSH